MLKNIIYNICFLTLFFGCRNRLAKDPTPRPYFSIEESKKNNAFVEELKPQQQFIEIEGHNHFIKNAWIEYPHIEKNFGDEIGNNYYCFVMELEYIPSINIDLSDYIKELGNGSTRVWFFLTNGREKKPYVQLQYRLKKNHRNKDKYFLFYRR